MAWRLVQLARINRTITKSRTLTAAGHYTKALAHNRRAIELIEWAARLDPLRGLANQSTLARLYYEQAGILSQLNDGARAVSAAQLAEHLYTDIDPTGGLPDLVAPAVESFRAQHGNNETVPFEELIGNAANARSFLAIVLARYQGRSAAESVERHGRNAVQTFTELIRVGLAYNREDLSRVRDQVNHAHRLLDN